MPLNSKISRDQLIYTSLDMEIRTDSIVRVIDAFVRSLDFEKLGIKEAPERVPGRPPYSRRSLLELYIYGYCSKIRSSRQLEKACELNLEAKWIMCGATPDFRTIADFRKVNVDSLKKVYQLFGEKLKEVTESGYKSVDGSKFLASNAKDSNFTANKLDDRIEWAKERYEEYLRQLDAVDNAEEADEELPESITREELERKIKDNEERRKRYEEYRKYMEENGLSQISLTDPDAKLMRTKNGFAVAYNVQAVVDSATHMIEDFNVTDNPTDHGELAPSLRPIQEKEGKIVEAVADSGYDSPDDMLECLGSGIVPHVILPNGQDKKELFLPYTEAEITDADRESLRPEELKKCLGAGEVPKAYEGKVEVEVVDVRRRVYDDADETEDEKKSRYGSEEAMRRRAAEGYFVRDAEREIVYGPGGCTLRPKSTKRNGDVRFANKQACKECPYIDRCYKGKNGFKEVDFGKDTLEKQNRNWLAAIAAEEAKEANAATESEGNTETSEATETIEMSETASPAEDRNEEVAGVDEAAAVADMPEPPTEKEDAAVPAEAGIEMAGLAPEIGKAEGADVAEPAAETENAGKPVMPEAGGKAKAVDPPGEGRSAGGEKPRGKAGDGNSDEATASPPKGGKGKYHYETFREVKITLRPDRSMMDTRKCLSEHPFGTVKRAMDGGYFLLRGFRKVTGETALLFLGYNIKRAMNLLGFPKLMAAIA